MSDKEQLQRLSEEVAGAYLRYLKAKTGDDKVTYDGVTKRVIFDELVFGLIGVAHTNARNHPDDPILKDPHKNLSQMINLFTRPYTLTDFGLSVIEMMNEKSIHKERGVAM